MTGHKAVIGFFLLISAMIVSAISMSVAWYIGASYMEITGFDISLTDPSLSLSTDNIHFKDSLKKESLTKVDYFKPVTTAFSDEWTSAKQTTPTFYGEYASNNKEFFNTSSDALLATNGFYSQELYVLCSQSFYLSFVTDSDLKEDEEPLFVANETKNKERAARLAGTLGYEGKTVEELTQELNDVIKALRISVLVLNDTDSDITPDYAYYIIDPFKEEETLLGGVLDNDLSGTYDSYNSKEILYGEVKNTDNVIYDTPLESDSPVDGELTCFNSSHQAGVKRFNYQSSLENGMSIGKEKSISLNDVNSFDETNPGMNIPLKAGVSKKLIISIYIEGWDKDNTNATMYGSFFVNLKLRVTRPII